jgi:hypothetical protein
MVCRYDLPSLERGLAVVQFSQLGLNACSLAGELVLSLHSPTLDVNLYGTLQLLLIGS